MRVVQSPEDMKEGELLLAVDERTSRQDIVDVSKKIRRPSWVIRDDKVLPMVAFYTWMLTDSNIEPGPCWVADVAAQIMKAGHAMVMVEL
jgi:hypothetical protein